MKRSRQMALVVFLAGCATTTPQQAPAPDGIEAGSPDAGLADAAVEAQPPPPVDAGFRQLFDGKSFAGWDRYLGIPVGESVPLGLENDPRGVYSVTNVDGEPAIRITGEVWGALISKEELENFELRLEYKWGSLLWPPLNAKDSGVMVLSTGALGAVNAGGPGLSNPIGSGAFMVSVEFQIAGGDIGGLYNLGPISMQAAPRAQIAEVPSVWNKVTIIVRGTSSEHFLNGELVTSASGYETRWPGEPVTPLSRGKIQLQSEGAEIYFRRLELRSTQ
jgi:hypothetical protein